MTGTAVWGIVRTILAGVGGYYVAKGSITEDMLTQVLGGLGTLFVAGWSVFSKTAAPAA